MHPSQAFDPIRSLQVAWKLLKQAPVMVLVGGLLLGFLEHGGSGGTNFIYRDHGPRSFANAGDVGEALRRAFEELKPWLAVLIPLACCIGLAFFALSGWVQAGFRRAVELARPPGKRGAGQVCP